MRSIYLVLVSYRQGGSGDQSGERDPGNQLKAIWTVQIQERLTGGNEDGARSQN
jgi:hypothetical protein